MIFGDTASGKSTFATALSQKLNIPVMHLDEIMDNVGREDKERIKELIEIESNKTDWIIEGNAFTKDKSGLRIQKADYIFVFETLPLITFFRHLARYLKIKFGYEQRIGSSNTALNLGYFIPYIFFKFPDRRKAQMELAKKRGKRPVVVKGYNQSQALVDEFEFKS